MLFLVQIKLVKKCFLAVLRSLARDRRHKRLHNLFAGATSKTKWYLNSASQTSILLKFWVYTVFLDQNWRLKPSVAQSSALFAYSWLEGIIPISPELAVIKIKNIWQLSKDRNMIYSCYHNNSIVCHHHMLCPVKSQ
jgi:hypothetical protein